VPAFGAVWAGVECPYGLDFCDLPGGFAFPGRFLSVLDATGWL